VGFKQIGAFDTADFDTFHAQQEHPVFEPVRSFVGRFPPVAQIDRVLSAFVFTRSHEAEVLSHEVIEGRGTIDAMRGLILPALSRAVRDRRKS
jgi:hypothetical protein